MHAAATEITCDAVHFRDTLSGKELERPADAVVVACGNRVRPDLAELTAALPAVRVLGSGDTVAPRTLTVAVREGHLAGRAL